MAGAAGVLPAAAAESSGSAGGQPAGVVQDLERILHELSAASLSGEQRLTLQACEEHRRKLQEVERQIAELLPGERPASAEALLGAGRERNDPEELLEALDRHQQLGDALADMRQRDTMARAVLAEQGRQLARARSQLENGQAELEALERASEAVARQTRANDAEVQRLRSELAARGDVPPDSEALLLVEALERRGAGRQEAKEVELLDMRERQRRLREEVADMGRRDEQAREQLAEQGRQLAQLAAEMELAEAELVALGRTAAHGASSSSSVGRTAAKSSSAAERPAQAEAEKIPRIPIELASGVGGPGLQDDLLPTPVSLDMMKQVAALKQELAAVRADNEQTAQRRDEKSRRLQEVEREIAETYRQQLGGQGEQARGQPQLGSTRSGSGSAAG